MLSPSASWPPAPVSIAEVTSWNKTKWSEGNLIHSQKLKADANDGEIILKTTAEALIQEIICMKILQQEINEA